MCARCPKIGLMAELLTIAETADRLGLSVKAVEKRIERGTIESMRKDGRRLIPAGEVARVSSKPEHQSGQGFLPGGTLLPSEDFAAFLEKLETLAAENGRFKALQEVNETEQQRLQEELFKARAEVQELEARLASQAVVVQQQQPTRRWFRRG